MTSATAQPCVRTPLVRVRMEPVTQPRLYTRGPSDIQDGQLVIMQEEKCLESGQVAQVVDEADVDAAAAVAGSILRVATDDDRLTIAKNALSAKQALIQARVQVDRRGLQMNLFQARYSFDRTRLTFQFTAEGRIDFRELLKDLAAMFRARIELRQVGAREETRVIGGFGPCGRRTCCSTFLTDLKPISIKMAKDQGLHQNPNKVTGLCGKLMCCLRYEVDFYRTTLANYPAIDTEVATEHVRGTVIYHNPVKETVTISIAQGMTREIPISSIRPAQSV